MGRGSWPRWANLLQLLLGRGINAARPAAHCLPDYRCLLWGRLHASFVYVLCTGSSNSGVDILCEGFLCVFGCALREKGATASQARPFQCAHVLVFRAFTVSVYMFLRQFCKRHWQSTSELVGLRRQVGAESVRSMHVHNFLSNSRASTSGLFVSRCVTHTIACVQVVSVVFVCWGVSPCVCS